MTDHTKLALILLVETLLFAVASLVHAGVLASGFQHGRAMIAEGVIGAMLGLGLLALLIWPARGPIMALVAQGSALLATLVGAFTIAVGVGPQKRGDTVFHVVLLVVLLAGIRTAWRLRRQLSDRAFGPIVKPGKETIMAREKLAYPAPEIVDRAIFQAGVDALHMREKAHTREGDAIAAARRRLPMVKVDGDTPLIGANGSATLLDAFEGRRMLIAYYYMWFDGRPAPEQCEGCTFFTTQVRELSHIHSRDATYATFCQGPYEEGARYRDFMGWKMPWYSVTGTSLQTLLAGRRPRMMYLICYLRQGSNVFETYWTTRRGVEAMDNSYRLLDLTVYGRQEDFEESPAGWPQHWGETNHPFRRDGRPISQWRRLEVGHSDDSGADNGRN